MNFSQLQPRHQDSVIGRVIEARSQVIYHLNETVPYYDKMQEWEKKEYIAVLSDSRKEFSDLIEYIQENEKHFDDLLFSYGHTTSTFLKEMEIKKP